MSAIAPLTREHVDTATTTITRAFASHPPFECSPTRRPQGRRLARLNRVPLEFGLRSGRVMQSHDAGGVAIWVPPGPGVTAGGLIRCGLLGAPFHLGLGAFSRFMAANATMEAIHKKHVAETAATSAGRLA